LKFGIDLRIGSFGIGRLKRLIGPTVWRNP
jgi:hypothetical protein